MLKKRVSKMLKKFHKHPFWIRMIPALIFSSIIFAFSSIPGSEAQGTVPIFIPQVGSQVLNLFVKKGAHVAFYMMLARSYSMLFNEKLEKNQRLAWGLVALFALSDEIHQGFIVARNISFVDVLIDSFAGWLALFLIPTFLKSIKKS